MDAQEMYLVLCNAVVKLKGESQTSAEKLKEEMKIALDLEVVEHG